MAIKIVTFNTLTGKNVAEIDAGEIENAKLTVKDSNNDIAVTSVNEITVDKDTGLSLVKTDTTHVEVQLDNAIISEQTDVEKIPFQDNGLLATNVKNAIVELDDIKVSKETGKGLSTNDFTNDDKTKLDNIEDGAETNVQSDWSIEDAGLDTYIQNKPYTISGTERTEISDNTDHREITNGNPHGTNKSDLGLENVDNTSDLNKPISTATQTALNNKADKTNVLELDNTDAFTPTQDFNPTTKKYVDNLVQCSVNPGRGIVKDAEDCEISVNESEFIDNNIPFNETEMTATNIHDGIVEAYSNGGETYTEGNGIDIGTGNIVSVNETELDDNIIPFNETGIIASNVHDAIIEAYNNGGGSGSGLPIGTEGQTITYDENGDGVATSNLFIDETNNVIKNGDIEVTDSGSVPTIDLTTKQILHCKMNDNLDTTNVVDSSSYSNDGTASSNTSSLTENGKINNSLNMVGTSAEIDFGNFTESNITNSEWAFSIWVYYTSYTGGSILSKNGLSTQNGVLLYSGSTGMIYFKGNVAYGTDFQIASNSPITLNKWVHIIGNVKDGQAVFYMDNVKQTDTASTFGEYWNISADVRIATNYGGTYNSDFLVDDLRIMNDSLSDDEISFLWADGIGTEDSTEAGGFLNLKNSLFIGDGTTDWRDAHQLDTDTDGSIIAQSLLHSGDKLIVEGDSSLEGNLQIDGIINETLVVDEVNNVIKNGDVEVTDLGGGYKLDIRDGQIRHFKLNDNTLLSTTVIDSSESLIDAKLYGGKSNNEVSVTGKINNAFSLDGSLDYIGILGDDIPSGNEARTVSLWFKTDSLNDYKTIINQGLLSTGKGFFLLLINSKLYFSAYSKDFSGTTILELDTWYHVMITFDGVTIKLILNGELEGSFEATLDTEPSEFFFGKGYANKSNNFWDGLLDDIRMFDRALIGSEILGLYNEGHGTEMDYEVLGYQPLTNTLAITDGTTDVRDDFILPTDTNGNLYVQDKAKIGGDTLVSGDVEMEGNLQIDGIINETLVVDEVNNLIKNADVEVTDSGSGIGTVSSGNIHTDEFTTLNGWAIVVGTPLIDSDRLKLTDSDSIVRDTGTFDVMEDLIVTLKNVNVPSTCTTPASKRLGVTLYSTEGQQIRIFFANQNVSIYNGSFNNISTFTYEVDTDYTFSFSWNGTAWDLYSLFIDDVDQSATLTSASYAGTSYPDGNVNIYVNNTEGESAYIDYIALGTDYVSVGFQNLTNSLFIGDGTTDWRDAHQLDTDIDGSIIAQSLLHSGNKLIVEGDSTLTGDVNVNEGDFYIDTLNGYVGIGTDTPNTLLNIEAGTTTSGQLKLNSGDLLTVPISGTLTFANDKFYITNVNTPRPLDRSSDVALSTVTVENTTVETLLWTATIPANSVKVGNVLKFHADGIVSNGGSTVDDEITIRVKIGGVTKLTLSPNTKTLTNQVWRLEGNSTQRTIGTLGSRASHLQLVIGETSVGDEISLESVGVIDTTENMDVTITAQWNSADINNVISLYQGIMEYKN